MIRVIVCGTTFGRIYIHGIQKYGQERFKLVGILASGSERSRKYSEQYGIKLFSSIDEINPLEVDLACVVIRSGIVGGSGADIALSLLNKGINVLQEQPVSYVEAANCMKTAIKNHCFYMINSFYPYNERIKSLLGYCENLQKQSKINSIEISCSVHVLFSTIDILERLAGSFSTWEFDIPIAPKYGHPLTIMYGKMSDIPVLLKIQNQMDPLNEDNSTIFLHRISVEFNAGTLSLSDTDGIIMWKPQRYVERSRDGSLELYSQFQDYPALVRLTDNEEITYLEEYSNLWPYSIFNVLNEYVNVTENRAVYLKFAQKQLELCKKWEWFSNNLSDYEIIDVQPPERICLKLIKEKTE